MRPSALHLLLLLLLLGVLLLGQSSCTVVVTVTGAGYPRANGLYAPWRGGGQTFARVDRGRGTIIELGPSRSPAANERRRWSVRLPTERVLLYVAEVETDASAKRVVAPRSGWREAAAALKGKGVPTMATEDVASGVACA